MKGQVLAANRAGVRASGTPWGSRPLAFGPRVRLITLLRLHADPKMTEFLFSSPCFSWQKHWFYTWKCRDYGTEPLKCLEDKKCGLLFCRRKQGKIQTPRGQRFNLTLSLSVAESNCQPKTAESGEETLKSPGPFPSLLREVWTSFQRP